LLVITADDFGMSPAVNEAVERAHQDGVLTAASLMVSGAAAREAVAIARRLPTLRVGLHLVLLEGRPTLRPQQIPDLVQPNGHLRSDMVRLAFEFAGKPDMRRQLKREIAAQFAAFARIGLPLDHVNAHKHFHMHPLIAAQVIEVGRQFGMPALRVPREPGHAMAPGCAVLLAQARRASLVTPDAVLGLRWTGQMTRERMLAAVEHLPDGMVEIYTHPATSDSFPGSARGYRYRDELAALVDRDVIAAVKCSRRSTGGYADAAAARPGLLSAGSRRAETIQSRP
jgi:hopanoid biosynthesis associated protein HpnK